MKSIEELLKNKVVKSSFAEVAEYLQEVLVKKQSQTEHSSSSHEKLTTAPPQTQSAPDRTQN